MTWTWRWLYLGPLGDQIEKEAEEERQLKRAYEEFARARKEREIQEYLDPLRGR